MKRKALEEPFDLIPIIQYNSIFVRVRYNRLVIIFVFIVALSLRFTLCLFNREANDNHLEVVEWIIDQGNLPDKDDCWECFQPKLYYLLNAGVICVLQIENHFDRILCMQIINFFFSFFILLYLWKFINRQQFSEQIKIAAFALLALNSCLTGINVQATNDTLVILAGILTIYFADRFFNQKKIWLALPMGIFLIIACLVKGSGLVSFGVLILIFCLKIFVAHIDEKKLYAKTAGLLLLSFSLIIPVGAGYVQNYRHYGTPFVVVLPQDPPPLLVERTFAGRPGITSIVDGYFTFRYLDMIRNPYIVSTIDNYQLHRTSLWSQLYGRTMFLHFDQHPKSWESTDTKIIFVGRWLIILGIVPLLLFIAGLLKCTKHLFKEKSVNNNNNWIHLVFVAGFLLFMVKYSYSYRDYSIMKSIFIFPALPSFIKFFMDGYSMIKSKIIFRITSAIISVILLLSIYDICFLINQLAF